MESTIENKAIEHKALKKKLRPAVEMERPCLHRRKILAYLDSQQSTLWRKQYAPLVRHLEECGQCAREFQHLKNLLVNIDRQIPEQAVWPQCQENFRREIREIFKKTPLTEYSESEGKVSKFFSNLLGS
jgi:hypothetical protein